MRREGSAKNVDLQARSNARGNAQTSLGCVLRFSAWAGVGRGLPFLRTSELKAMLADMQRGRDAWRDQAQPLALPNPDEKPMTWWRWLRTTGCLAGVGILLALAIVAAAAQQQPRECFTVAINPQASLGSILIDKCTGKTWLLGRSGSRFSNTIRWFPITTDTNE